MLSSCPNEPQRPEQAARGIEILRCIKASELFTAMYHLGLINVQDPHNPALFIRQTPNDDTIKILENITGDDFLRIVRDAVLAQARKIYNMPVENRVYITATSSQTWTIGMIINLLLPMLEQLQQHYPSVQRIIKCINQIIVRESGEVELEFEEFFASMFSCDQIIVEFIQMILKFVHTQKIKFASQVVTLTNNIGFVITDPQQATKAEATKKYKAKQEDEDKNPQKRPPIIHDLGTIIEQYGDIISDIARIRETGQTMDSKNTKYQPIIDIQRISVARIAALFNEFFVPGILDSLKEQIRLFIEKNPDTSNKFGNLEGINLERSLQRLIRIEFNSAKDFLDSMLQGYVLNVLGNVYNGKGRPIIQAQSRSVLNTLKLKEALISMVDKSGMNASPDTGSIYYHTFSNYPYACVQIGDTIFCLVLDVGLLGKIRRAKDGDIGDIVEGIGILSGCPFRQILFRGAKIVDGRDDSEL
ncbi:MAG: hypothetical protein NZZ41_04990 [Candidatus Dojkabacteria bacterium]|nr:hypothetical protein [Candidatus Dojkabacteria bacterium]